MLLTMIVPTTTDMGPENLDRIGAALVADGVIERVTLRYLDAVQDLTPAAMETSLRRTQPERWEVPFSTIAQTWMEQGLTHGRSEGEADLLQRHMEWRFGEVPESVRTRVIGVSTDEPDV